MRKVTVLILKPLFAVGFVGVMMHLLRAASPGLFRNAGALEAALQILLATLCLSIYRLDSRLPNMAANHGGVGLAVGLLTGLIFVARMARTSPVQDSSGLASLAILIVPLLTAIVGAIFGLVIGVARGSITKFLGRSAKPSDGEPDSRNGRGLRAGVIIGRRVVQITVFGTGLVVIFLLCVTSPPVIDAIGIEETLCLGNRTDAGIVVTAEEKLLKQGHGDGVVDMRFSADGRTLRTVVNDGTVSTWDTTTMKMLRRITLPAGYLMGDIRPSDGQYILCSAVGDPTRPVQVVDLDTGKSICEVALPVTWNYSDLPWRSIACVTRVYWLADQKALCIGYFIESGTGVSYCWWRFNYRTGKILESGDPRAIPEQRVYFELQPDSAISSGLGEVTEDGNTLFLIGGGFKGAPPNVAGRINLKSFRATDLGEIERPVAGEFGLVPGGNYFHLGLHIYGRRSLNLVAAKEFPQDEVEIRPITFSADGSRYAARLWHRRENAEPESVVFVHETLTRSVLLAFTPPTAVSQLRFSPDGTQLGIAYCDGSLELRSVPPRESERTGPH